jgi:hypothetical protein
LLGLFNKFDNASISTGRRWNMGELSCVSQVTLRCVAQTYQQRPRVQASFVLLAIEIRAPELEHSPVVPPQEKAYGALDQIRNKYESPEFGTKDVLWCKFLFITRSEVSK